MKKRIALLLAVALVPMLFAAPEVVWKTDFTDFAKGLPAGWSKYESGKAGEIRQATIPGGRRVTELAVSDPRGSLGLTRQFPAVAGRYYRATLETSPLPGKSRKGAFLQLRFHPYPLKTFGNSEYLRQVPLKDYDGEASLTAVDIQAPAGSTQVAAFIVTAGGTPEIRLLGFKLESSDAPFPPLKADPMRIPGVLEIQSRDLVIDTDLVAGGKNAAIIVVPAAYRDLAAAINAAVKEKTGVELQVIDDRELEKATGLAANVITIGSRDVNRTVAMLYNRHYTLLDGKYPGVGGGMVIRSVHDVFGDKHNVITLGGSDEAGDRAAVERFCQMLRALPAGKDLKVGYLADIKLGRNRKVPASAVEAKLWENCPASGDSLAFGWNLLSKNLALFYMTGDTRFAAEFLRLAFPDAKASDELNRLDGEFVYADLHDPLGKPYHYNATMLMLYWDLVEEHPFFSAEDRLRVTRKFYQQLQNRRREGDKGIFKIYEIKETPAKLLDRHYLSEAMTVYVLGRYFDKYYPSRDGRDALAVSRRLFATLDRYPAMNVGSLFWYNTFLAPAIDFALLDGGVKYVKSPVLERYIANFALLADRTADDWSQQNSTMRLLYAMAYLAGNQAPADIAGCRRDFNADEFRLGQSFFPAAPYPDNFFADTDGKWKKAVFEAKGMEDWNPPFPKDRVVEWLSFRRDGAKGPDFALLDAKYESGRNPFHNFALVSLRLAGVPLLRGCHNQLHCYRDGLGSPKISRFTEILDSGRVGETAFVRGKLADFNGFDWERLILIRENGFLLEIDAATPLADAKSAQLIVNFEAAAGGKWSRTPDGELQLDPPGGAAPWTVACSLPATLAIREVAGGASLKSNGLDAQFIVNTPAAGGQTIRLVSVLRPGAPGKFHSAAQADNQVALRLPDQALLTFQPGGGILLREKARLCGVGVEQIPGLFRAEKPVAFEADGKTIRFAGAQGVAVTLENGQNIVLGEQGSAVGGEFSLPAFDAGRIEAIFAGRKPLGETAAAELPQLAEAWKIKPGDFISEHLKIEFGGETLWVVAVGNQALLIDRDGKIRRTFPGSAMIGALCFDQASGRLYTGAIDEKLRCFDFATGKELWNFTSAMPDGIKYERMWWSKDSMPGVCKIAVAELEPGKPLIFVGGAGVLEILSPEGKLLKRNFQEWGTFEGMTVLPEGNGRNSMLSWGFMVGHPTVYRYAANLQKGSFDLSFAADGTFMGSFGFGYIGRNNLEVAELVPGQGKRFVGDFNGSVNRIQIRGLDGKVEREIDLGFGIRAFGGIPYGKTMLRNTNVRGLELVDFEGKGTKSVAVAFNRNFVAAFTPELASRFYTALPADPLLLATVPGKTGDRLAVACADGSLFVIDGAGKLVAQGCVEGRPTLLSSDGNHLIAGTDRGELTGFSL